MAKDKDYARDIEALHKRLNVLEQGGALPPERPAQDAEVLTDLKRRLVVLEKRPPIPAKKAPDHSAA